MSDCFIDQNFKNFSQNQIWWSKLSGTCLNQKQPFTGVYSRLQKKHLFVSICFTEVVGLLKEDSAVFLWVCLKFQNKYFTKHVWVVTASAKHHSFSFLRWLISKMLLSTLAMFWLSLNISTANTMSRKSRQLVDLLLIN